MPFSGMGLAEGITVGGQLPVQAKSILITVIWIAVASFIILKIAAVASGLRVNDDAELKVLTYPNMGSVDIIQAKRPAA